MVEVKSDMLTSGDSGGGLFVNGHFVGNLLGGWMDTGIKLFMPYR
jgi:hypothetical protein